MYACPPENDLVPATSALRNVLSGYTISANIGSFEARASPFPRNWPAFRLAQKCNSGLPGSGSSLSTNSTDDISRNDTHSASFRSRAQGYAVLQDQSSTVC